MIGTILLALVVLIGGYLVWAYNGLVKNKNLVAEGWSGIDVQLRRRADLVPNLVETVKGYATHEDKLFRDIAELRAKSIAGGSVSNSRTTPCRMRLVHPAPSMRRAATGSRMSAVPPTAAMRRSGPWDLE